MRKIFLLFAGALLAALSANAQNVVATAGQNVNLRLSPYGYIDFLGMNEFDDRGVYGDVYDGKYEYVSFYDPEYEWQFGTTTSEGPEYFNIEGCGHLYDMTYDGEYAYGGEGTSNVLYCVDLSNRTLVSKVETECKNIVHCTYDPVEDGFWIGDSETLMLVGRDGKTKIEAVSIPATSGSAYYQDNNGNRKIWLLEESGRNILEYNIDKQVVSDEPLVSIIVYYTGTTKVQGRGFFIGKLMGLDVFMAVLEPDDVDSPTLATLFYVDDNYEWTNSNPAIGLPEFGTGTTTFMALNDTDDDLVATISYNYFYYDGGEKVEEEMDPFTITIKPLPAEMEEVDDITAAPGEKVDAVLNALASPYYSFDDGTMQGWKSLDADGDRNGWFSTAAYDSPEGRDDTFCLTSASYDDYNGEPLYPDNYLVSPEKFKATTSSYIKFYVAPEAPDYPEEHYGVAVSTKSNPNADDFETIAEWTIEAASEGVAARDKAKRRVVRRADADWTEQTVDLSKYAGQEIWVAIRHFDCTDQYYILIDDITIGNVESPSIDYAWTNDNPAIGLAAEGTGPISFEAVNDDTKQKVANISVRPCIVGENGTTYGTSATSFKITVTGKSGIVEISADDNTEAVYYNVSGVQVPATNLVPGVYVRRCGDKAAKVIVR